MISRAVYGGVSSNLHTSNKRAVSVSVLTILNTGAVDGGKEKMHLTNSRGDFTGQDDSQDSFFS
jgi:hypothetical protein